MPNTTLYIKSLKTAIIQWWQKDPFTQSAAVAYYTIFSFPALMILFTTIASQFMEANRLGNSTHAFLSNAFGNEAANQLESIVEHSVPEHGSIWALIFALLLLSYVALKIFVQLQKALNYIWGIDSTHQTGIKTQLIRRGVSLGVMLATILTMILLMLITSTMHIVIHWLNQKITFDLAVFVYAMNIIMSWLPIFFLFTLLLKKLPDTYVPWRCCAYGALLASLMFLFGQQAMGYYFSAAEPSSAYGVAGAIILLMLWVSYSCTIFLLGAEYSKQLAQNT